MVAMGDWKHECVREHTAAITSYFHLPTLALYLVVSHLWGLMSVQLVLPTYLDRLGAR